MNDISQQFKGDTFGQIKRYTIRNECYMIRRNSFVGLYKSFKLLRSLTESDLKNVGVNPVICLNCLDKCATLL